ncbi:hypothetical protein DICPUDRAFT_84805 [Dictyostelium purpureum]|uniref:Peptidase C14 caspase domain-containing protein n=1 Tax=Dictyostelium purpureum TaxID=5786 RepID=F1A3S9_DICPU|nr:uncharacterized protein DICPUDRAFT_84805 [Dictyostelium purpureum]EGC29156.1 hypothetical protein DICPUDRAFT_84805 [Dictyostelium purpureum]|eukprot:XP_003294323.1 hypothetical protein DICPUDRAFT_84805 [Dictyostelium purpureum]
MDASTSNIGYYSITQDENERYIQKKVIKNLYSIGNPVNGEDCCKENANAIYKKFSSAGYYAKLKYDVGDLKSNFLKFLDGANYSSLFVDFVFYYSGEGIYKDGQIYLKDKINKLVTLDSLANIFEEKTKQLKSKQTKSYKLLFILDIYNGNGLKMEEKLELLVNLYENRQFSLQGIKKGCAVLCSPMIESYPIVIEDALFKSDVSNGFEKKVIKMLSFTKFLLERLESVNSPGRVIFKTSKVLSGHIVDDFIGHTAYQLSTECESAQDSDLFDKLKFRLGVSQKENFNSKDITKILGLNYSTLFGDIFVSDFILIQ